MRHGPRYLQSALESGGNQCGSATAFVASSTAQMLIGACLTRSRRFLAVNRPEGVVILARGRCWRYQCQQSASSWDGRRIRAVLLAMLLPLNAGSGGNPPSQASRVQRTEGYCRLLFPAQDGFFSTFPYCRQTNGIFRDQIQLAFAACHANDRDNPAAFLRVARWAHRGA